MNGNGFLNVLSTALSIKGDDGEALPVTARVTVNGTEQAVTAETVPAVYAAIRGLPDDAELTIDPGVTIGDAAQLALIGWRVTAAEGTEDPGKAVRMALTGIGSVLGAMGWPDPVLRLQGRDGASGAIVYRAHCRDGADSRGELARYRDLVAELISDTGVTIDPVDGGIHTAPTDEIAGQQDGAGTVEPQHLLGLRRLLPPQPYTGLEHDGRYLDPDLDIDGWLTQCRVGHGRVRQWRDAEIVRITTDPLTGRGGGWLARRRLEGGHAWGYVADSGDSRADFGTFRRRVDPTDAERRELAETEGRYRHERKAAAEDGTRQDVMTYIPICDVDADSATSGRYVVRTGIRQFDERSGDRGLMSTTLTIISGAPGAGKTTLIGQITLQAAADGNRVAVYSGELSGDRYKRWLYQQYTGRAYTTLSREEIARVDAELGPYVARIETRGIPDLYAMVDKMRADFDRQGYAPDLVILDNLMFLDLAGFGVSDPWQAQIRAMGALKTLAADYNTAIILVAHPNKTSAFIRVNDILGSAAIHALADNVLLLHRTRLDMQRSFRSTFPNFGEAETEALFKASNLVEVAKEREGDPERGSMVDVFVPLYFDPSSRRLRNSVTECVRYVVPTDTYAEDRARKARERERKADERAARQRAREYDLVRAAQREVVKTLEARGVIPAEPPRAELPAYTPDDLKTEADRTAAAIGAFMRSDDYAALPPEDVPLPFDPNDANRLAQMALAWEAEHEDDADETDSEDETENDADEIEFETDSDDETENVQQVNENERGF